MGRNRKSRWQRDGGIDFIYAQTNDAFGQIETVNVNTGKKEFIGSWNERFSYTDEDIDAYLIQYGNASLMLQSFEYWDFVRAIATITAKQ